VNAEKSITIAIIKPDVLAVEGKKAEIVGKIRERGYEIVEEKTLKMSAEQASEFYKQRKDEPRFDDLVKYMTSGESCVLALTKSKVASHQELVESWRKDVGPTELDVAKKHPDTLRAQYATDQMVNALHGSDSHESALRLV
jgi:nucleoside diphosphate kinase